MDVGKGREQDAEALARDYFSLQKSRAKDSLLQNHSFIKSFNFFNSLSSFFYPQLPAYVALL